MAISLNRIFNISVVIFGSFFLINCSNAQTTTKGEWLTRSSMPTARKEISNAAVTINDKIYVVGGVSSDGNITDVLERYDPGSNDWITLAPLPNKVWRASAAESDGKLYVFGGYQSTGGFPFNLSNRVFEYDPSTDEWTEKTPMSAARGTSVAVNVSGKIHVIGGASSGALKLHEAYDPSTDSWEINEPMITARSGLTAIYMNGKIYVVGGYFLSGGVVSQSVLEAYDVTNETWESLSSMPITRHGVASAVVDNRMFVFGGGTNVSVSSRTLEYDPVSDSWRQLADLPSPVSFMGVAELRDTIYVMGGGEVNLNRFDGLDLNSAFIPPDIITSIEDDERASRSFELNQNYPNPFNPVTTIEFSIPEAGKTTLIIYDLRGQEVARLVDEDLSPGRYSYDWDALEFSSGIYINKLSSNKISKSRKMVLLK